MGQTTITVSEKTLSRFKRLKDELNAEQSGPDQTNESFLHALMDTWEAADEGYYDDPQVAEIVEQLKNEISMANDPGVGVDTERIIGRLDDIEAQLPQEVANQVTRRMNQ